jgi:hypothetical protein
MTNEWRAENKADRTGTSNKAKEGGGICKSVCVSCVFFSKYPNNYYFKLKLGHHFDYNVNY